MASVAGGFPRHPLTKEYREKYMKMESER